MALKNGAFAGWFAGVDCCSMKEGRNVAGTVGDSSRGFGSEGSVPEAGRSQERLKAEQVTMRLILSAVVVFAGCLWADEVDDRSRLLGAWQAEGQGNGAAWVLEEKGEAWRVVRSLDDGKRIESECNVMGKECAFKDSKPKRTVSMWFSGAKLVEMETSGKDVVKRRFAVVDGGQTLEVEVTPLVPAGKTETMRYRRVELSAAQP